MRFLFLTQYFPPEIGASQTRLLSVIQTLQDLGHEVEVVTGFPNYPTGRIEATYRGKVFLRERYKGIRVTRTWLYPAEGLGRRRWANYVSFAISVVAGLAVSSRPDIVYVESPPLTLAPAGLLAARLWRRPSVLFVADPWPDSAVEVGALGPGRVLDAALALERWAYSHADCVATPTLGLLTRLEEKGVPERRLTFLPNGIDPALFSPRAPDPEMAHTLSVAPDDEVVLYAGTVGHVHGVAVAVRAMGRLRHTHPYARLLVVGAGSELEFVRELAADQGTDNVTFVAPQPLNEIARTWSLARVGLSTQRDLPVAEITRPVKMLASMASGVPVVYSGSGEGARLIREADAGVVVPPEDGDALALAIGQLLDDPGRSRRLGESGRAYVMDHLTWGAVVERWLEDLATTSPRMRKALRR